MTNLEKQLRNIIEKDTFQLGYFIVEKAKSKFWGKKNRKELTKLLPLIIENTNEYNSNWIDYNNMELINTKGFLDTFIENINRFHFEDNDILNSRILYMLFLPDLNDNQMKKIIDNLLECDCTLDPLTIDLLLTIIDKNQPELKEYMLNKYIKNEKTCDACVFNCNKEHIYENVDFILANIKNVDLFNLKKKVNDNKEVVEKIKNKIEKNKRYYINITINRLYNRFIKNNAITSVEDKNNFETILEVVYLIIEDICKNEKIDVSDMNILNNDSFSSILELGDKVIKIGCERGTKTFHNNPYVNAMLLRKEFVINEDASFYIEVNEKVDTKASFSEEELYQLYKKLREINLIWTDVATRNVGKLLKDNTVHWCKVLPLTEERLGLQPYRGKKEVLKKGELIILDNDCIFDENDEQEKIVKYNNPLQKEFEHRYQQEKELNNNLDISEFMKINKESSNEILPLKR